MNYEAELADIRRTVYRNEGLLKLLTDAQEADAVKLDLISQKLDKLLSRPSGEVSSLILKKGYLERELKEVEEAYHQGLASGVDMDHQEIADRFKKIRNAIGSLTDRISQEIQEGNSDNS